MSAVSPTVARTIEPLWRIEDVAEYVGISVEAVYMSRHRSEFPGVLGFKIGRRLRFDPDEVRASVQHMKAATRPTLTLETFGGE